MSGLPKTPISWPIQGGLDTKNSPLSVQPGSALTLDNVVQESANRWRRRNGFTQVAADTMAFNQSPFAVANSGPTGMVSADCQFEQYYRPALASNRWVTTQSSFNFSGCDELSRKAIARTTSTPLLSGFSSNGTYAICTRQGVINQNSTNPLGLYVSLLDIAGNVLTDVGISVTFLRARCASMTGYQVAFVVDDSGNLSHVVANLTTGTLAARTLLKTGVHLTTPYLDAMYYTGSTITVVVRMAAGGFQFLEFNPATGALATDVNIAGAYGCVSLIAEPSGSGTRIVGLSDATNTIVKRVDSTGTVLTTDTAEAVVSTQITGCASASGVNWSIVYQTSAGTLRKNDKVAGVVGTAGNLNGVVGPVSPGMTLDGQGWGEPGDVFWYCLLGNHSAVAADPQHTSIVVNVSFLSGEYSARSLCSVTALQGQSTPAAASLFQAVRTGTRTFAFGMPVLVNYAPGGLSTLNDYEMSAFTHSLLTVTEIGTVNKGVAAPRGDAPILPSNSLREVDGLALLPIGLFSPPRQLVLTQGAGGGLTLLGAYQYIAVIETENSQGQKWRSPPSVAANITLTGANRFVTYVFHPWQSEHGAQNTRLKIYRTNANGSQYRLLSSTQFSMLQGDVTVNDVVTDAALASAELLYTAGEQPNICWPPASHCWVHDDRLWAVNRDFRTEIQYSKNLRANRQPETSDANGLDIDDEFGDITNGCSVEGRGIVFKRSAIYFVQGDGLTDAGTGENYRITRIAQDVGSLPGSPIVVAGDTVFFVSERGIYSVNTSGGVIFVGADVDQYLNQPLVQTKETVYDGCFVPARNEVRFVTTNYILVYNRNFPRQSTVPGVPGLGLWTRWTGLSGMRRCLVINGKMVLFKTDGTVWREGDETQLTDQGNAFTGIIRSAWVRPNQYDGQIRLYRAMCTATRTSGGGNITPTLTVYMDNSDTAVQSFTPPAVIAGATTLVQMEARPQFQNCSAFSLQITLPNNDNTFEIEKFGAEIGIRGGAAQKRTDANRWT